MPSLNRIKLAIMALNWNIPKFDAHVHLNTNRDALMRLGIENNISYLSINTDIPFFDSLENQEIVVNGLRSKYPNNVNYVTSFSISGWGTPEWEEKSIRQIQESLKNGAIGVKVWKNIGMNLQDKNGSYIGIDHSSFDAIFNYLEKNDVVVLGHIGEPKNCWLPLTEMTVDADREYFKKHPEYHMYLHPELPSYEDHLEARNNRLLKNPRLRYVGLHLGSQEWETDEVGRFLDKFPLAAVDLAERICHLQHQAVTNWQKVYDFFIKYQDRIIYGSDVIDDNSLTELELMSVMEKKYQGHWQFFTSSDEMNAPKVSASFCGLGLPTTVVEKIYYANALKWYKNLKHS